MRNTMYGNVFHVGARVRRAAQHEILLLGAQWGPTGRPAAQ